MTEITPDGRIRHGVYLGLREDKSVWEDDVELIEPEATLPVRLTHPEKLLFPDAGVTKMALARYCQNVAEAMGPYAFSRPVSLVRAPDGPSKATFFQKHATAGMPKEIATTPVVEKDGATEAYLMLRDAKSLMALAQIGALEVHLWGARADKIDRPDRLVFDLDPDEEVGFDAVTTAAFAIRDLLDHAGLRTFALLTGGKGVYLVAPLARRNDWNKVAAFALAVAQRCEALAPDRFTAALPKARRKGRIFIDHLRNRRGATAVSPYSTRARTGAPVAAPIERTELAGLKTAAALDLREAAGRAKGPDPWRDYAQTAQSITQDVLRRLDIRLAP